MLLTQAISFTWKSIVLQLQDGILDGQPVWALLFFCLRCGDLKAVKHVIDRAK